MTALHLLNTSPSDIKDGDVCPLKIVAVAGHNNDWAAYIGPSHWSDDMVANSGDKVTEEQAKLFAYLFQLRTYRT